jgi:serine/threonine protein kinase
MRGQIRRTALRSQGNPSPTQIISKTNVKRSKIDCLREEAKLLSTIDHPNIVKVHEFVETDTFIYLKMELVKNGALGMSLPMQRS